LSYRGLADRASDELRGAASLVGTPDYVAPEILLCRTHSFSVDYWSLGAMVYEFVMGVPPFHADNEPETCERVLLGHAQFPQDDVSSEFVDFVTKLLVVNPEERLGHARIEDIIEHPWLVGADGPPPFVPELSSEVDTAYFEQRYAFDSDEDASIMMDLQSCGGNVAAMGEIKKWASVDLEQLLEANTNLAREAGVPQDEPRVAAPFGQFVDRARHSDAAAVPNEVEMPRRRPPP
jgi:serine/threonine protein kinase